MACDITAGRLINCKDIVGGIQAANAFVINDGVYTQHNTGANEFIYYEG